MVKPALPKPFKYACEKGKIVVQQNDGKVDALLSHSDKVIWRIVNNALSGKGFLQTSEKVVLIVHRSWRRLSENSAN